MTLRERLARWLYPSAFVQSAPVTRQQPDTAPKRLAEDLAPAPVAPEPPPVKLPQEYEAWIQYEWGTMPLAATATRARVLALVRDKARREDIAQAITGRVVEIE